MPRLRIRHRTELRYAGTACESVNEVRLVPRTGPRLRVERASLEVRPGARMSRHVDAFGNEVRWFQVVEPHDVLTIDAEAVVTSEVPLPLLRALFPSEQWTTLSHPEYRDLHAEHLAASTYVRCGVEVAELADELAVPEEHGVDRWVLDLADAVSGAVAYERGATAVDTPVEDVARHRRGVCQDLAHLMIALCRQRGVPARYVSGWLYGPATDGPAESHAWVEAHVPGAGWIEVDPTHPGRLDGHHVRVATGRDYADVPPLRGSYTGAPTSGMTVTVEITQLES
jgi:transglutaminase-like putative cysteine protease